MPSRTHPGADDQALNGEDFILPGGKVDPDAIRDSIGAGGEEGAEGEGEGLRRVTFKLTRDLDKRLDKYLTDRITFMSRNQLQRLIEVGGVTVNRRVPKASTKLHLGDVVEVVVPPPPSTEIQPEDIPLSVLYEDDVMIVINKQADLIVHPARSHNSGTLLNALVHHFRTRGEVVGGLSTVGKEFARPGVVHRLDKHTSGVMVVAKDDEAHWKLGRQFEERRVDKRYLALVEGEIEEKLPLADVLEHPIGPHPSKAKGMREKQVVRHDELGKPAVTIYRVRERFRGYTLVELELKTGRTHQIRVHMSHVGFPLVGDDMYGGHHLRGEQFNRGVTGKPVPAGQELMMRQALHACVLGIAHPKSLEKLVFTAPAPDDFTTLIKLLREHRPPKEGEARPQIGGATIDLDAAIF